MDYSKFTVIQLKQMLKRENLNTNGKKGDLVNRLEELAKKTQQPKTTPFENVQKTDLQRQESSRGRLTRSKFKQQQETAMLNRVTSSIHGQNQDLENISDPSIAKKTIVSKEPIDDKISTTDDLLAKMKPFRIILNRMTSSAYEQNQDLENKTDSPKEQEGNSGRMTRSKSKQQQKSAPIETQAKKRPSEELKIQLAKRQRIDDQRIQIKRNQPKSKQRSNNRQNRKMSMAICLPPSLRQYELIWAHVKGYSLWPGIIEQETPKGRYTVHFFGDYSRCDVTRSKILHMMEGFNRFSTVDVRNPLLNKAINEAKFFVFNEKWGSCPICDMFSLKIKQNA